jgi:hypothetical protein
MLSLMTALVAALLLAVPGRAVELQPTTKDLRVKSLIVQYRSGYEPRATVPIPGSSKVSSLYRDKLRLGLALGSNMWRVDFISPVNRATALTVAKQLAEHRLIVFAEIDGRLGIA